MLERKGYLARLGELREKNVIKLLTGMRGSGKTALLAAFAERLRQEGVPPEQVVELNFDDLRYGERLDGAAIHAYLRGSLKEGRQMYLFLDELERAADFEQVVGRLYLDRRLHIYMAASHRGTLAGELATVLSGGYVEIPVLPLSLAEYRAARAAGAADAAGEARAGGQESRTDGESGKDAALSGWLRDGGLPRAVWLAARGERAADYLEGIYHTVLVRDILERSPIRDFPLLRAVLCHVAARPGAALAPAALAARLKAEGRAASAHTVADYLRALTEAGILYAAGRRDMRTGEPLRTAGAYYLADLGLRNLLLPRAVLGDAAAMENLVYLELRRRGMEAAAGRLGNRRIDFVAQGGGRRRYIQLGDRAHLAEKLLPLQKLGDQYPKQVLLLDAGEASEDVQGIRVSSVCAFLEQDGAEA